MMRCRSEVEKEAKLIGISLILLVTCLLAPQPVRAQQADLQVWPDQTGSSTYRTLRVVAEEVEGVEIRVSAVTVRRDCNNSNEHIAWSQAFGEGRVSGDTYVAEYFPATMQTLMNCPGEQPVSERIFSEPLIIRARPDEQGVKRVSVTWVIPEHCQLEVVEIE